jgi:hypothetical protein
LTPAWKPSEGASAAIWLAEGVEALLLFAGAAAAGAEEGDAFAGAGDAAAGAGAAPVADAGPGTTTVLGFWPALIAAFCAENVVDATGHPLPGPFRFWSVTAAAFKRASCEALELSVGKDSCTEGLLRTWPALTFWLSSCR